MPLLLRFVLASLLIALPSTIVVCWLALAAVSYDSEGGLMPWVAAGVILYGPAFVAVAVLVGIPGILWSNHLIEQVPPNWRRLARLPIWVGASVLAVGSAVALAAWVRG